MERHQRPDLEAFEPGQTVLNASAESARRWPRCTAAEALGFRSVHVVPMRVRTEVLGSLPLLYRRPTVLGAVTDAVLEGRVGLAQLLSRRA
jgi:GAF domain-containing protein